jgi:hypothetical protein
LIANHSKEDVIYPLTVKELAKAQCSDPSIQKLAGSNKYTMQLVKHRQVLCKGTGIAFLLLSITEISAPPLSSTPQSNLSKGDTQCCDVLGRYTKYLSKILKTFINAQ